MVRVVMAATGEELATISTESRTDLQCVRDLKQDLRSRCGIPRFRQRLVHQGDSLDETACLSEDMDLQLVFLSFPAEPCDLRARELIVAAARGNADEVEAILHRPQDPNWATANETNDITTPLCQAAALGHSHIASLLLEALADADRIVDDSNTPLLAASADGREEVVRLLLEAGAKADTCPPYGSLPLVAACEGGHTEIVHLLLEARADANASDPDGEMPLHAACLEESQAIVQLLVKAKADTNRRNSEGRSPLHVASTEGHGEVAWTLLEAGADWDVASLHAACRDGFEDIVQMLLIAGADPEARWMGCTPLFAACRGGSYETVSVLLASRAHVDSRAEASEAEQTPLFATVTEGHTEIARLLLFARADIDAKDATGRTPLRLTVAFFRLMLRCRAGLDKPWHRLELEVFGAPKPNPSLKPSTLNPRPSNL